MNKLVVIVSRKSLLVIMAIFGTCAVDSDMQIDTADKSRVLCVQIATEGTPQPTLTIAPFAPPLKPMMPLTLVGLR